MRSGSRQVGASLCRGESGQGVCFGAGRVGRGVRWQTPPVGAPRKSCINTILFAVTFFCARHSSSLGRSFFDALHHGGGGSVLQRARAAGRMVGISGLRWWWWLGGWRRGCAIASLSGVLGA